MPTTPHNPRHDRSRHTRESFRERRFAAGSMGLLLGVVAVMVLGAPHSALAGWNCSLDVHLHAVDTAVEFLPAAFRHGLGPSRVALRRRIRALHESPSRITAFRSTYRELTDILRSHRERESPFLAVGMADLSMILYARMSPIRLYDFCRDETLLAQASVLFDGVDRTPDYTAVRYRFETRQTPGDAGRLIFFYNRYVNELVDLWVSLWVDAGRKPAAMPPPMTLVRGTADVHLRDFLPADKIMAFARSAFEAGRYETSARAYADVLAVTPTRADARYGMAVSLFLTGRLDESLVHFKALGTFRDSVAYTGRIYERAADASGKLPTKIALLHRSLAAYLPPGSDPSRLSAEEQARAVDAGYRLLELLDRQMENLLQAADEQIDTAQGRRGKGFFEKARTLLAAMKRNRARYRSVADRLEQVGYHPPPDAGILSHLDATRSALRRLRRTLPDRPRPAASGKEPVARQAKTPAPPPHALPVPPGTKPQKTAKKAGAPASHPATKTPPITKTSPATKTPATPTASDRAHETAHTPPHADEAKPREQTARNEDTRHPVSATRPEEAETSHDELLPDDVEDLGTVLLDVDEAVDVPPEPVKTALAVPSKTDEMKTAIQAFKAGYNGDPCADAEEAEGGAADRAFRHRCCVAGQAGRTAGLTYYQALSDFLAELHGYD